MGRQNPSLVIMAEGMGSRFDGLKQIEPVDPEGHIIIDFSLFDAWRAGFRDVVFIIKREMEAEFRECFGDRMERYFHVSYRTVEKICRVCHLVGHNDALCQCTCLLHLPRTIFRFLFCFQAP